MEPPSEKKLEKAAATIRYLSGKTFAGWGSFQVLYDYFEAWSILLQHQITVLDGRITVLERAVDNLRQQNKEARDEISELERTFRAAHPEQSVTDSDTE